MATTRLITADDLLEMELEPGRYDLIDGELYHMAPAGEAHGHITMNVILPVGSFVRLHDLGRVYAGEAGFVLARDPDVVVAPEVAFVRNDRLNPDRDQRQFLQVAPDFAVEVISPSDYPKLIREKIVKYMEAGVPLLLVIYPESRTVHVLGVGREPVILSVGDVFDGGDVLPGFRLAVADIFQ